MLTWPKPDALLEASTDSPTRRTQRASRAALDVIKDRNATERGAVKDLAARFDVLLADLERTVFGGKGSITDFKRFDITARLGEVDRMIKDASADLARAIEPDYQRMVTLGDRHVEDPLRAAQLQIRAGLPGLDAVLVRAAFDNTVELLTQPMQQFGSNVKVALRGVALAGDNKSDAIARLRDQISGQGMDTAAFKAERIIRTELSRSFNGATYQRLVDLAREFPFLRKGWRAAGDNRTRKGHREAATTYARGQGIKISDRFKLAVYDERGGKALKLLGYCYLLFPVDPNATPVGRIAAAATIMCRCNGFVDFDLADFAAFTAATIQGALGGVLPTPGPTPVPAPAPAPRPTRKVPPKAAKVPTPATDHRELLPGGPTGGKLSGVPSLPKTGPIRKLADRVLAAIDRVHGGDGLGTIPIVPGRAIGSTRGQYAYRTSGQAVRIEIMKRGLAGPANNTLAHEVGHWIDHQVIGRVEGMGRPLSRGVFASQATSAIPTMAAWKEAVKASQTYQTLRNWSTGADGTPVGVNAKHLSYLLSADETWARAYAQYIAVRSGDVQMLAELRVMQQAATVGKVAAERKFNRQLMGVTPDPNSWDYPKVWQDDEFEPIAKAMDKVFEAQGWRKP